jgi:hypothetical protein
MGKKQTGVENIFARTEPIGADQPVDTSDLNEGNIRAVGVGLTGGEMAAVQAIADSLGLARNAVLRYAVRWFVLQYRAGRIDLAKSVQEPPPPKKKVSRP